MCFTGGECELTAFTSHSETLCDVMCDIMIDASSHEYSWWGRRPRGQCELWGSSVKSRSMRIHEAENCERSSIFSTLHSKDCDMQRELRGAMGVT